MQQVQRTLEELSLLVTNARGLPLSASCVVDRKEVLDLLARLGDELPAALAAAQDVLAGKAAVLAEGRAEAQRLVDAARAEQRRLVEETEVAQAAQEHADAVVAAAEEEARDTREKADSYADQRLAALEIALDKIMTTVANGRRALAARNALEDLRDPADGDVEPLPGA